MGEMIDACDIGAREQKAKFSHAGWRPMATAPRDGTPIELRCTYGVAPWYGLYRWTDEGRYIGSAGETERRKSGEFHWWNCNGQPSFPADESSLSWRPFTGDPATYADPTQGAQDTSAYWRGAVAATYGLKPNAFERPHWWQRLAEWFGLIEPLL